MTLLSAIVAAVVSIWNALHGKALAAQVARAEILAAARHQDTMRSLTGAAPAEMGLVTATPPSVRLGDFFKYEQTFEKLLSLWKGFKHLTVGESVEVPETVLDLDGKRMRFAAHQATRER
jgi:hypothetical protein